MVNKVGSDSIRFMMLYRKNEAPLEFDFKKVTEQSKDNPVFYVQYAHARISSVIRKLSENNFEFDLNNFKNCQFELLTHNHEINLIKKILDWSSIIETSVALYEPHRIAYYLYDLASNFHSLWNQGKVDSSLRFIDENNSESSYARIGLIIATQRTIQSGLTLLGVSAPNEMQ
jgi:arginyl-tRNA synthetase